MQKRILIFSIFLNISLLTIGFQFRDKIFARFFPPEKTTILLVGDSRIAQENWSVLLDRNDIKNEAFGGAITQQILWNLERGQLNSEPEIVILEGGINDLLAGVSPQRVYENYLKMIEILRAEKIKIIVNSTVYSADNQSINNNCKILNTKLEVYCGLQKIPYLDMNIYLSDTQKLLNKYSSDGIHLKSEAYLIWAKELKKKII